MNLFRRKRPDAADSVEGESLVTDILTREGLSACDAAAKAECSEARSVRSPEDLLRAARSVA